MSPIDLEKQSTNTSMEKGDIAHAVHRPQNEYEEETAAARDDAHRDIDHGFDPEFVKRTRRKVDWRVSPSTRGGGCRKVEADSQLIPCLGAIYSISLIDRNNLSFARAANNLQMMKDLGMTTANNGYGECGGGGTCFSYWPDGHGTVRRWRCACGGEAAQHIL